MLTFTVCLWGNSLDALNRNIITVDKSCTTCYCESTQVKHLAPENQSAFIILMYLCLFIYMNVTKSVETTVLKSN